MVSVAIFYRRTLYLLVKALINREPSLAVPMVQIKLPACVVFPGYSETTPRVRGCVALGLKGQIFRVRGGVVRTPGNLSPSHTLSSG